MKRAQRAEPTAQGSEAKAATAAAAGPRPRPTGEAGQARRGWRAGIRIDCPKGQLG
ncbi:MAG: hypothetical protein ACYTFX_11070 [Planctomycetota bacterium]